MYEVPFSKVAAFANVRVHDRRQKIRQDRRNAEEDGIEVIEGLSSVFCQCRGARRKEKERKV